MQTFLPYADFQKSFECLDYRRLGKQRVEAFQILCANEDSWALQERTWRIIQGFIADKPIKKGWKNHPASVMWKPFPQSLRLYYNMCIDEWTKRGYNNSMRVAPVDSVSMPSWFGDENLHSSHRAALLFKKPEHYSQFNWKENPRINYVWISKPR